MKHISMIVGILIFLGFAWEMEHGRTFFTWLLLLISILNILNYAIDEIVDRVKKHIDNSKR